jgi:hypothetical protein
VSKPKGRWQIRWQRKRSNVWELKNVSGTRLLDFGIREIIALSPNRQQKKKVFVIDHVPTGSAVIPGGKYLRSEAAARRLVMDLYDYGDWSSSKLADYKTEEKKEAYMKVREAVS